MSKSNFFGVFEQRFLFTNRSLSLEAEGLLVKEKTLNEYNEFTVPYEDLLPLGTARVKHVPVRLTAACLFLLFGCGKVLYDYVLNGDNPGDAAWLLLIMLGVLSVAAAFTAKQWSWDFIITTGRGNLRFTDVGEASKRLPEVVEGLRAHAVTVLREKYLWIDSVLPVQAQVERMQWLRELNVIDEATYRAAKQELLSGETLPQNGMGSWPLTFSLN